MNFVVVGCGSMGLPMAIQLRKAGFDVNAFDVRPNEEFPGMETHMLGDLDGLNENSVLLIVVRDSEQIMDVCFDSQAVFARSVYPKTVVVSSTVSPRFIDVLRQRLPSDVELVDAPMSGAPYRADDGTLTFMIGGQQTVIDRLMPAFEVMGQDIHVMGDVGQGMLTKVMNNYVAACSVVAVRRTLDRAAENGLTPKKLLAVMRSSSGSSWFGDNLDKINWSTETYAADNTIGILEKDVKCAVDATTHDDEFDLMLLKALRDLPEFPDIKTD